jgi:methionyl-tRNA synthetase
MGHKTYFLTGTDEHGEKVQRAAEKQGIPPRELTDKNSEQFKKLWQKMGISYDDFIRTTEERHYKSVQAFLDLLNKNGDIYLGEYEGWYCVPDETYWTELQLDEKGNCPTCHRPVERLKESSYFFRMSKYQGQLLKHLELHPDFIQPEARYNEIKSFLEKEKLRDLSISRTTFNWGIPIPGAQGHVTYVWVDALANYISALGWPDVGQGKFKEYWPADVHLIGKDILKHHAVYWPCLLMAAGIEQPKSIFAHGWWTVDGQKMSKSLGNFVDPNQVIDQFGLDQFRYFLMREVAFGQDGDFSLPAMKGRINSDLADDLGNLLSRVCGMVERYFKGTLTGAKDIQAIDRELEEALSKCQREVELATRALAFYKSLISIWEFVNRVNKYVDSSAPWALAKDPAKRDRLETVLHYCAGSLRAIALLLWPYIPGSSEKMWERLTIDEPMTKKPLAENLSISLFKPTGLIKKPEPLFPHVE